MISKKTAKKYKEYFKREQEFMKLIKKNWLSPAEQKRQNAYIGGRWTNKERADLEIYEFVHDKPEKYFAYTKEDKTDSRKVIVTNWTGLILGTGYWLNEPYRDNMGGTRRNFRINAINGWQYSGISYGGYGSYCRLKKIK